MSTEGTPGAGTGRRHRRWLPFWGLQVAELVIAVVLVDVSIHVDNAGLLVAAAALFAVLAVTAKGPLGILRWCGQPLHLVLAVVAGVVVAVAPVVPAFRPDIEGIIVVEFGAIGLIRLATFTAVSGGPSRIPGAGRGRAGAPVIDSTARIVGSPEPPGRDDGTPDRPSPPDSAAPQPAPPPPGAATARWAGRAVGQAGATGKKAAAVYGPLAGAGLRRAIRSAGRVAGQAGAGPGAGGSTGSARPPEPPEAPGAAGV